MVKSDPKVAIDKSGQVEQDKGSLFYIISTICEFIGRSDDMDPFFHIISALCELISRDKSYQSMANTFARLVKSDQTRSISSILFK